MKMVHIELDNAIISNQDIFTEWIIELPVVMTKYVQELCHQCSGGEGRFVLSQGDKEIDLSKKIELIMNPFMIEINGRKILNKLYSELDKISKTETMYMQTLKIARDIKEYILSLEYEADYSLEFETELDVPGLLKIAGVKYEETEIDFLEKLIRYIKIIVRVLSIKVIVFINLRSYLSETQMQEVIKEIEYQEIQAIFMENQERVGLEGGKRYIIDKDQCEIY